MKKKYVYIGIGTFVVAFAGMYLIARKLMQKVKMKWNLDNLDPLIVARMAKYIIPLKKHMTAYEINTPLRIAHFLGQLIHESGGFRYTEENLNYSASGLGRIFGKYFPTTSMRNAYARQPMKIANKVYADRMGNGSEASGDGWRYRGRGLIQLTGKYNYRQAGRDLKLDLVGNPEQVAKDPDIAVLVSVWYWNKHNLNALADQDDVKAITRKINGGTNGLHDRIANVQKLKLNVA